MTFDTLFTNPRGRTSRAQFIPALIVLLAVEVFYEFLVTGRNATWCLVVLLYPGTILLARRFHDMGRSAWPLIVPLVLMIAAFCIWLKLVSFGAQLDAAVPITALVVSAAFVLWGCVGGGQTETNRFGAPAA
jgi:uncharacterized membrane protein YhaH (DUF805 family)